MEKIIGAYLLAVALKWVYEALDAGWAGYWKAQRLELGKKAILHVPLAVGWASGALLGVVNGSLEAAGIGALTAGVTWQSSLAAGWMLDSLGKPLAKRLKAKAEGAEP